MRAAVSARRPFPFQFVIDELWPIRPITKRMFGFTYVYLGDKLLLALRDNTKRPQTNGVWVFTQAADLESLRREFPTLPRHCFWKSGKNGWVVLASKLEDFEESAFKVCEMILRGDQRIGRVTRGGLEHATRPRSNELGSW